MIQSFLVRCVSEENMGENVESYFYDSVNRKITS